MNKKKAKLRPRILLINRAIVLDKNKVLIIKRADDETYNPSKWEAPGGKLDKGQDISSALEREVLEETNLVVIPIDKVAYYRSGIVSDNVRYNGITYIELFGITKRIGGTVHLSSEHTDFKWITLDEIYDFDLSTATKEALLVLEEKIRKTKV